jgi:hypothetical protein
MCEDGHIAGDQEIEKEILQLRRRRMVRRLDQDVAGIGDRKQSAGAKPGHKIGGHMNVSAGGQLEVNAVFIKRNLELFYGLPNRRTRIVVEARQDMRCAGNYRYALLDRRPRHLQRNGQIAGTVVDAR